MTYSIHLTVMKFFHDFFILNLYIFITVRYINFIMFKFNLVFAHIIKLMKLFYPLMVFLLFLLISLLHLLTYWFPLNMYSISLLIFELFHDPFKLINFYAFRSLNLEHLFTNLSCLFSLLILLISHLPHHV